MIATIPARLAIGVACIMAVVSGVWTFIDFDGDSVITRIVGSILSALISGAVWGSAVFVVLWAVTALWGALRRRPAS